ncbi:hypothetical protein ZTR_05838 [Talaromyces verruculosus]|nr:hypothetical protein ZTR_05838 [Talaromyces verruculosus]
MSDTTTPPAYDFAMGETVWETLKKNVQWKKGFDDSMTYRNNVVSVPWHVKYPFEQRIIQATSSSPRQAGKNMVIVDIGGNQGVDLDRLASSFPDLECDLVLQDIPETLSQLREKGARLDRRIRMMEYDFFTAQPLHGADIHYLKSVLHDWNDSSSLRILSNTAKAMTSTSRLLINEMALADTNESLLRAEMDMLMLFLRNGMERTKSQWEELLGKVEPPLKIAGAWSVEGDEQSVIEVCLVE